MKALIIGNGRAGKRHEKHAQEFGLETKTVDPVAPADYPSIEAALDKEKFDIVVIASPPNLHLEQIELARNYDMWVLCEKPLCGLGQYDWARYLSGDRLYADKTMVSFNYRYHPMLDRREFTGDSTGDYWSLYCVQYRPTVPEWGLLLDHLSHDFDILRWQSGGLPEIHTVKHVEDDEWTEWEVIGMIGKQGFRIADSVNKRRFIPRVAMFNTPYGRTEITAHPDMFTNMWADFLRCIQKGEKPWLGLEEAVITQRLLEDTNDVERY